MANQALLAPLIDDLITRESDPGELHVFPYCNGELRVSIRIYTSDPIHIAGKLVKSSWDKYLGTVRIAEIVKLRFSHNMAPKPYQLGERIRIQRYERR